MPNLSERLSNLGLKKGTAIPPPKVEKQLDLCEILKGEKVTNSCGDVVVIKQSFPYGYQHGDVTFTAQNNLTQIHKANHSGDQIAGIKKLVFLDTETTGLAGGTGTLAFLVGVGMFTETGFELTQFMLENPADETAMLLELSNYAQNVEGVVTFNGKSFDMPLLKTRFKMNRLVVPFLNWAHLDLLHLSRKIWKLRLPSRALKDLEQEILHLPRTDDEVPGWMIPEIYFNFLRTQNGMPLKNVAYHNAMDIVSLAALFILVSSALEGEVGEIKLDPMDQYSIGRIYESLGDFERAMAVYGLVLKELGEEHPIQSEVISHQALVFKKTKELENALPLWKSLAIKGDLEACIELSKYFEHEKKELSLAFDWVVQAEINLDKYPLPRHRKNRYKKELNLRKARLEKRMDYVSTKSSG